MHTYWGSHTNFNTTSLKAQDARWKFSVRETKYSETGKTYVCLLQGILRSAFKFDACQHLINTELDCPCIGLIFLNEMLIWMLEIF